MRDVLFYALARLVWSGCWSFCLFFFPFSFFFFLSAFPLFRSWFLLEVKEDPLAWRNNSLCGNCSSRLYTKCPMFRCEVLIRKGDAEAVPHLEGHTNPNSGTRALLEELQQNRLVQHFAVEFRPKHCVSLCVDDTEMKLGSYPFNVKFEGYTFDFFAPSLPPKVAPMPIAELVANVMDAPPVPEAIVKEKEEEEEPLQLETPSKRPRVEEEQEEEADEDQTPSPPVVVKVEPPVQGSLMVPKLPFKPYVPLVNVKREPSFGRPRKGAMKSLEIEGRNLDKTRLNLLLQLRLAGVASEEDKAELQMLTEAMRTEEEKQ